MNSHNLNYGLREMLSVGVAFVRDPGDAGTIGYQHKAVAICRIESATSETRVLPSASAPIGQTLTCLLWADGGDVEITGADQSVILQDVGDFVTFKVASTKVGDTVSYVWRVVEDSRSALRFTLGGGAAPSSGLVMGGGTTADPITTDVASGRFIDFVAQSTASSGDNRLAYLRYVLAGTGGGECLRAFTKLAATVGTARGAHISLDIDDSPAGVVTGLGVGVDAQILIGNAALASGTYAVVNAEIYSAGATSDPGGNPISCFRAVNNGNATGMADVDDDAALIAIDGFTSAAGTAHLISSTSIVLDGGEIPTCVGLRVTIDGADHYIPAFPAASWN